MRTAYYAAVNSMPPHILHQVARTLNGLRVPEAVLHRGRVLRVNYSGRSITDSMVHSLSQDRTYKGGLPLAEQSATQYWRGVEGRTVLVVTQHLYPAFHFLWLKGTVNIIFRKRS